MKTISRTLRMLAATALSATVLLSQAVASPIVSIVPNDQTIAVGDPASIDIIVSGLTDPVGGYSILLTFNGAFISGTSYTYDPDGKMGTPVDFSFGFTGAGGSPLDIFLFPDAGQTEASLSALQGASFRLATVSFLGVANGLSPLTWT